MTTDHVLQSKLDSYKTHKIPLEYIYYRWSAPHFPAERRIKVNGMYDEWSNKMKDDSIRSSMAGKDQRIRKVYNDICAYGMINPLIVKPHSYSEDFDGKQYYVIVGNQRLAILRAMAFQNKLHKALGPHEGETKNEAGQWVIPCIIANEDDNWEDHTLPVRTYVKIDPNRTQ